MATTRVEKFKSYRDEIKRMDENEKTARSKASRKVDSFFDENDYKRLQEMDKSTMSISYDEIMDAASAYDEDEKSNSYSLKMPTSKRKIFFYLLCGILLLALAALIIYFGLDIWVF